MCIAAAGADAYHPNPHSVSLGQSSVTPGREYGGGQASHEIIRLTYPETSVCVTLIGSLHVCAYMFVFGITEWRLWLLKMSMVIKLPS